MEKLAVSETTSLHDEVGNGNRLQEPWLFEERKDAYKVTDTGKVSPVPKHQAMKAYEEMEVMLHTF
jgi:hypothetical protein